MRLYSFSVNKQAKVGVERNGKLVEVPVGSMIELIAAGKAGLTLANKTLKSKSAPTHDLKKAKLLAPIPRPGKILCSGLNYNSHIEENPGATMLSDPLFLAKFPETVIGPGQPIRHPGEKYQMDYEVELAAVFWQDAQSRGRARVR